MTLRPHRIRRRTADAPGVEHGRTHAAGGGDEEDHLGAAPASAASGRVGRRGPPRPRDRSHRGGEAEREAGKKARRWVVERTHSWFNRYRRLLIRWEKKAENYLGQLHLAAALIT